jgi:hypothetical protein
MSRDAVVMIGECCDSPFHGVPTAGWFKVIGPAGSLPY